MKLYRIGPRFAANSDNAALTARMRLCIAPIADLIVRHVADDPALFGIRHVGESAETPISLDTRYGYAEAARIPDAATLREVLMACGDPDSDKWVLIRSLVTCRAVHYCDDGHALVCVPSDADPIVSTDEALIAVEERSHKLAVSDLMDGLLLY
jgi:hypothetical protein